MCTSLFPSEDALSIAVKLSEGHCFEVEVLAMFRVDCKLCLHMVANYHVNAGWYRLELEQIINVWLDFLEEISEQSQKSEITEDTVLNIVGAGQLEQLEITHTLPACLVYCPTYDAPLATVIRTSLSTNLGKEGANEVFFFAGL